MSALQPLLVRHLRLLRHLLELWHATVGQECPRSTEWVAHRQRLLDLLVAHDGPGLAAESYAASSFRPDHPLAEHLARLHASEVRIMEAILRLDNRMRTAGEARLREMERELRGSRQARGAARAYAVRRPGAAPLRPHAR